MEMSAPNEEGRLFLVGVRPKLVDCERFLGPLDVVQRFAEPLGETVNPSSLVFRHSPRKPGIASRRIVRCLTVARIHNHDGLLST